MNRPHVPEFDWCFLLDPLAHVSGVAAARKNGGYQRPELLLCEAEFNAWDSSECGRS
jgi:hypothetical protein